MPDSLKPIFSGDFLRASKKLEDFASGSSRAFLIGAGCSRCAGLPLMKDLTNQVSGSSSLKGEAKEILDCISGCFDGATEPTIEDFMSEMVDLLAIAERRKDRGAKDATVRVGKRDCSADELNSALLEIKDEIAKRFLDGEHDVATHRRFVKAVHRTLRSGKALGNRAVNYVVLNYDTLIEDALALEKLAFADGFCGGSTAWWDAKNGLASDGCDARVLKVHGSIDWCDVDGEPLPRRIRRSVKLGGTARKRVLIWPVATKYRETQNDPYAQILEAVRASLRSSAGAEVALMVCGYRFADSHINLEIERALRLSGKALSVLVFTECEKPEGVLKEWTEDDSIKEQVLIYARRGFFHGPDTTPSSSDLPWWKFENLVRILDGER